MSDSPVVLILAAGKARRYGADKRRVSLGLKKTLLQQSISQYTAVNLEVLVCLSASVDDDSLELLLNDQGVDCLRCRRAQEGMGGTLAESVSALGDASSVLIGLGDMPGLLPATILRLLKNADSEGIVYPVYQNRRGHPVLFGRRFLPLLRTLSGDRGASKILKENAQSCVPVVVSDPGVVWDVDTPSDRQRMLRLLQARSSLGASG